MSFFNQILLNRNLLTKFSGRCELSALVLNERMSSFIYQVALISCPFKASPKIQYTIFIL